MKKIYIVLLIAFLLPLQLVASAQSTATTIVAPISLASISSTGMTAAQDVFESVTTISGTCKEKYYCFDRGGFFYASSRFVLAECTGYSTKYTSKSSTFSTISSCENECVNNYRNDCAIKPSYQSSTELQIGDLCSENQKEKVTCMEQILLKCDGTRWNNYLTPSDCETICKTFNPDCISNVQPIASISAIAIGDYKNTIDNKYCAEKDKNAYTCAAYNAVVNQKCGESLRLSKAITCAYANNAYKIVQCGLDGSEYWQLSSTYTDTYSTFEQCAKICKAADTNCIEKPVALYKCSDYIFGIGTSSWSNANIYGAYKTFENCNAECRAYDKCIDISSTQSTAGASCNAMQGSGGCVDTTTISLVLGYYLSKSDCDQGKLCLIKEQRISSLNPKKGCESLNKIWCTRDVNNPDNSGYCAEPNNDCINGFSSVMQTNAQSKDSARDEFHKAIACTSSEKSWCSSGISLGNCVDKTENCDSNKNKDPKVGIDKNTLVAGWNKNTLNIIADVYSTHEIKSAALYLNNKQYGEICTANTGSNNIGACTFSKDFPDDFPGGVFTLKTTVKDENDAEQVV